MNLLRTWMRGLKRAEPDGGVRLLRQVEHTALPVSFDAARRTEDIKFSPSGRVLAVVATNGQMFLFAVDATRRPVQILRSAVIQSPVLLSPHGVDFLGEDVVVVANRGGCVTFFRLPNVEDWRPEMTLEPIHEMHSNWFGAKGETRKIGKRTIICGPGSVRVRGSDLLVACNKSATVTIHPFTMRGGKIETSEGTLLTRSDVGLPDGVAVSRDGRWVAVSDHTNQCIAVYSSADNTRCATLHDSALGYPHGLCFDPTGHTIYSADAGGRLVHAFVSNADWSGSVAQSTSRLTAVDEAAFCKTHASIGREFRPLEGGIKGIDVAPDGRLIATTCQNQVLRFFEADA